MMKTKAGYIAEIEDLLEKRLSDYPYKKRSFHELNEAMSRYIAYLIDTNQKDGFRIDDDALVNADKIAESAVFICGSMKSGTTLLTQLFDNHPDLVVMPGDSHFYNNRKKWQRSQYEEIAAHWIKRFINPTGKKPFWFLGKNETAYRSFLHFLDHYLKFSDYDIPVCVVLSIFATQKRFMDKGQKFFWVEKTPHNELHADELRKRYPQAKFIHVIRDPLNTITSLKRIGKVRGWRSTCHQYANLINRLFTAARKNLETFGENTYLITRYEDLVSEPRKEMQKVCEFLNIGFDNRLLVPTESGRLAMSNSMFRETQAKGHILNLSRVKRYETELSKPEIEDIVNVLYRTAIDLGYQWDREEIKKYKKSGLIKGVFHLTRYLQRLRSRYRTRMQSNP